MIKVKNNSRKKTLRGEVFSGSAGFKTAIPSLPSCKSENN
jgi:hypothetical protein